MHKYENKKSNELLTLSRNDKNSIKMLSYLLLDGCQNNNVNIIKECLSKGCNINFQDYDKRTGLHIAVEEKHQNLIDFLKENGADENIKDRWGKTPKDLME